MEIDSELFQHDFRLIMALIYGLILTTALRQAHWSWIFERPRIHVFLGSTLCMGLLWHVHAQIEPMIALHIIGATTVTLMFGWSLAIISTAIALIGLTINGQAEWDMFAFNGIINGVIPVTLSQLILLAVRTWLPKNFFIFVLGNGFLTAGLSSIAAVLGGFMLLILGGVASYSRLADVYLPFLPMLLLPEGFLNGWVITGLVCYRPEWIYSFKDELYLDGK